MIKKIIVDCSLDTMDTRNQNMIFLTCWGKTPFTLESYIHAIYSSKVKVKDMFSETKVEKLFSRIPTLKEMLKEVN